LVINIQVDTYQVNTWEIIVIVLMNWFTHGPIKK